MSKMDYLFAVASIRVREKYLLTDADVSQMAGMKDEREVLQYLTERGWGSGDPQESADEVLRDETDKNQKMLTELKVSEDVIRVLAYPQIYHNLKAAVKEVGTAEDYSNVFFDIPDFSGEKFMNILQDKNYKALPEDMQQAAEKAMEIMLQTHDGQRSDIIIDRACLVAMLKAGRKTKDPMIIDYTESTVAVSDIRIAVRAQKTGKDRNFYDEALAPCASLSIEALRDASVHGRDALLAYLTGHGFAEAAEAIQESPSAFERWCDNRLIETIRPQKTNSVSAGPIVAYYLARENEIKTARIILTAVANGFSEDEIRERVREMYA